MTPTNAIPMAIAIHVEIPEIARSDPAAMQMIALVRVNRFDIL
ncbi:hypothetical protein OHB02_13180 [Streptomyces albidoflavus]|nr:MULTISPECIES: hypothetical protein [unclassified Streptomyces]WSB21112.1 hypothetical protein OHB02_13180 [Streptomyces albidoflavus]